MTYNDLKSDWSVLAKKTKRCPLFVNGAPRIKSSCEWTGLVPSLWSYIGSFLFCVIGAVILSLVIFNPGQILSKVISMVLLFAGTLLFVGGLLCWVKLKQTAVFWRNRTKEIIVSYGWPFMPRAIVLNRSEIKVRLAMAPEQSGYRKGWTVLSLCSSDCGETAVYMASSQKKESLISIFNQLQEFLGIEASDDTLVEITSPGGEKYTVSRIPISQSSATFKTMEMVVKPDLGLAVLRPTIFVRLFFFIFFCIGIGIGCGILLTLRDTSSIWSLLLMCSIGVIFALVGVVGFFVGIGVQRVEVDRNYRHILVKWGPLNVWRRNIVCRFDDVAAIQVCSRYEEGSETSYDTYELNIVFYDSPQAKRLNVLSYSDQARVLSDAQILADFISKPLLNHS